MVRRLVWDQDGAGSIPVTPTKMALRSESQSLFLCLLRGKFFVLDTLMLLENNIKIWYNQSKAVNIKHTLCPFVEKHINSYINCIG